jgi:hypothetical protein
MGSSPVRDTAWRVNAVHAHRLGPSAAREGGLKELEGEVHR